jgi:DNA-binding CsgD family transcriptional regulator
MSRSAELTPDPERAAHRRVGGAEAALASGSPLQVHALISLAKPALRDPEGRARADRLEGNAWIREGKAALAAPILLSAGTALMSTDAQLGRQTLLEAVEALLASGSASGADVVRAIGDAACAAPPGEGTVVDMLLDAYGVYLKEGFVKAAPRFRAAVIAMSAVQVAPDELVRWAHFATYAARALWDEGAHATLMNRLANASRERGALSWLAVALKARATSEVWAGRFDAADLELADAADVSFAAGEDRLSTEMLPLDVVAIRGLDAETRATARSVIRRAAELGCGSAALFAHHALVVLALGQGRYRDASDSAVAAMTGRVGCGHQVLADMVEAAARAGDCETAQQAIGRLSEAAPASGTPWAMGLLVRSRAVMAGDDGEALYQEALELLGSAGMAVEVARAHLLYGEWLRRQKRRIDAREQLRIAYESFETMGAEAFAERARVELLATGARARKRTVETSTDLTPQEVHVARLAASGETNAEIAAQLFIGTSTVEYHLRKVFRKLSITSRRQLKHALPDQGDYKLVS